MPRDRGTGENLRSLFLPAPMQSNPGVYAEDVNAAEEAAVLFAAGFVEPAMDQLVATIRREPGDRRPWLMLLDLYRVTARRSAFELVAARYARTFQAAAPSWEIPRPSDSSGTVALEGGLSRAADLDPLHKGAAARKIVVVDMGGVERLHYAFAAAFVAALRNMKAGGKRVILIHVAEIHATLLEMFGAPDCAVVMRHKSADEPQLLAA